MNTTVALLYSGDVGAAVRHFLKMDSSLDLLCCEASDWRDERDDLHCRIPPQWLRKQQPDWLVLAWWPRIVSPEIIGCAKHSLNIHNSYLPWCRGKHPNFWALVEGVPYGVTLHEVTGRIDGGGTYVSESVPVTWEDTGESLHLKAKQLAVDLFRRTWPSIVTGAVKPGPPQSGGSYHAASELEQASRIPLGCTTGRELLNLIRARQAYGHAAWFIDHGERYEVTISIKRKSDTKTEGLTPNGHP